MSEELKPFWTCGCGALNGLSSEHCGVCKRDRGECQLESIDYQARCNDLTKANDDAMELVKDRERLQHLSAGWQWFAQELHNIGWIAANDAQWHKLKALLSDIRQFLDSAIEQQKVGGE